MPRKTVLLVCYGNICRSPMAEGFLNMMLKRNGRAEEVKVLSAGLNAVGGTPTAEAIETMREEGIEISGFMSRQLTRKLIEEAELILTMEKRYKDDILSRHPQAKGKVFTLKEFAGETVNLDIEDPYGKGIEAYKTCAMEIKRSLANAFKRIVRGAS